VVQALGPIGWILMSPYGTAVVVAEVGAVRDFVTRNHLICAATGWLAMAAMVYGTLAMDCSTRVLVAAMAAPFAGLAIWVRHGGSGGDEPIEPLPPGPTREREEPKPLDVTADCGRRQRADARRTITRRGAIAPPSRTRSKT
jgi:hypothetical protein